MRDHEKRASQLSVVQVLAGALAAVSAALVASAFVMAGTLLGAAVTSLVATVAGALYTHSLKRARARIRIRRDPATGALAREVLPPADAPRRIAWGLVGGAAALVFALALGAITALELVAQRPVASLLGRAAPGPAGTSLGALVQGVRQQAPATPLTAATPEEPVEATPPLAPGAAPASTATAAVSGTPTRGAPTAPPASTAATEGRATPTVAGPAAPPPMPPLAPTVAPAEPAPIPTATPPR